MKKLVQQKSIEELKSDYPIADRAPGWFFRQHEASAGTWIVEGTDLWGRQVSRSGVNPEVLLDQCVADAQAIKDSKQLD